MLYCKKCLMPNTRPGSIFNDEGICQACINFEKRKSIDWKKRNEELVSLCNKFRRNDGYYDCIIPVSGGKDSHFLVYKMKIEMNMNPLLLTVGDPFTKTKAGLHNLKNLSETFNCDHVIFNLSTDVFRRVTRLSFEEFGEPLRFIEAAIYTVPFKMALRLNIPLVVFGENSAYEYGSTDKESASAKDTIYKIFSSIYFDFWVERGFKKDELNVIAPLRDTELEKASDLEVIFMSYFEPWSSVTHYEIARKYGFKDLSGEWERDGCVENFEQIDSMGYMVHLWLKYPKFGFQRTTDIVSRRIREGRMSISEGKRLIMENDHKLDTKAMLDFINFLGYTPKQFWEIVEKFWNTEIFEKVDGIWKLKNPIYKDLLA